MNLKLLSSQLTKIYNTLGNEWLTQNFETEPFDMRVFVRKGGHPDYLHDYEVEIYTDRKVPKTLKYKEGIKPNKSGAHISYIIGYFKDLAKYVDSSFGDFSKTLGVTFMDVQNLS